MDWKIAKIYFDMDGVLADFSRGVRELCKIEPAPQEKGGEPDRDAQMWEQIRLQHHFYDRLQIMPGAKEMFDVIYARYGNRCEILTGIPKRDKGIPAAAEDKMKWIHRLFSKEIVVHTVLRKEKALYCKGKEYILIDDFSSNIRAWEECGGTGIRHISPEKTLRTMQEMGLL